MKAFSERPVATAMVYLGAAVLGVYSFLGTPLELAPKEDFPKLTIQTSWPGVPPEIIQTQVTSPLEEAASSVKGVTKVVSSSSIGQSRIDLEFGSGTDMNIVTLSLGELMAKARETLPYGTQPPQIIPYIPEDFRVAAFLDYTISGSYDLQSLYEAVKEKLEYGLVSVKGVSQVRVVGGADPEIRIALNREKMEALGLHPYHVFAALAEKIRTYPAGKIRRGSREFIFKVSNAPLRLDEFKGTVVSMVGGVPVRLGDLADVEPSYRELMYVSRINGQPTIRLTVFKEKGESTLKVASALKKRLEEIRKDLPPGLVFRVVNDEGDEIRKNLGDLYILAGIILVVVFGLVFIILRKLRPSLLILSSIAFSVLITFNLIRAFGISLNMLTLGALALGFGMFVDNSIVVFENTLRLREQGASVEEAVRRGPRDVFLAVLASTLTTVCVFFTFPYFQGRLKVYYLPLAVVIASALLVSLFVSFTLIPALSPRLLTVRKEKGEEKGRRAYDAFLRAVLGHPLETLLIIGLILFGSYRWFKSEVTIGEFFRWYAKERLYVQVEMPAGTDIAKTDELIRKFESKVMENAYDKEMNTLVASENAYLIITFPPEVEHSFRPYALKEQLIQLATQFAGVSIGVSGFDPQGYYSSLGAGTYYDSYIKFLGYNLKKLGEITSDLERTLRRNPRIKDIKIISSDEGWWRVDSFEHVFRLDREALRRYRIDPDFLYFHLQSLISGEMQIPLRTRLDNREIPLLIKFPEAEDMDLDSLLDMLVRTRAGEYLRLGDIGTVEERAITGSIDRENQQFQQTVLWEFRGPNKASENYRKAVFSGLRLPAGFSATMEERWRMTEEEKKEITFAILFSVLIIFMILAALYESLIQAFYIILAVPLALVGVFVAFVVAGAAFDSSAYIGVILLGGIVVNNAILVVDHINYRRRQGDALLEAVVRGTRERVRPVFMTTSTTVLGMLPLILIQVETGKTKIWSSLALSTVGGLTSSTIFILIVMPLFYYYGDGLQRWAATRWRELRAARRFWSEKSMKG